MRRHLHGWRKALLASVLDVLIVVVAYYLILAFRYQGAIPLRLHFHSMELWGFIAAAVGLHLALNWVFHVYSIVNKYVGLHQALWVLRAATTSVLGLLVIDLGWPTVHGRLMPLSVVVFGGYAAAVLMLAVRFYSRVFHTFSLSSVDKGRRVIVVGAGSAAEMLIRQINSSPHLGITIVGLLDDNQDLHGMRIHEYRVLGPVEDAPTVATTCNATEFFIAIPSANAAEMERLYNLIKPARLPIKTLPPLTELMDGRATLGDVRELTVEDLLGRQPIETDLAAIGKYLRGRRVLVTGAAGSIGSELCRQIAAFEPDRLVCVDRNESGLYALHEELRVRGCRSHVLVATHVQQRLKMRRIFVDNQVDVVFHAAAFKHVPLMESSPDEAVVNNVAGTLIVAEEAARAGVQRFVNISTDKAADPVSAMGASKAMAELVVRDVGHRYPESHFCSVRFGNVLNSQGSVVPIFQKQIDLGGPVTVTHPEMTRYFMSISEAVQLVLQAATLAGDGAHQGGVFILRMGEPVRILELARKMIKFTKNGHSHEIDIVYTGLRPGERMHELLVGSLERPSSTSHPFIDLLMPLPQDALGVVPGHVGFRDQVEQLLALGQTHATRDVVIKGLRRFLPTYRPFDLEAAAEGPFVAPQAAPAMATVDEIVPEAAPGRLGDAVSSAIA